MKVSIKDLAVSMEIKNRGVELDVYSADGETHLGDLVVSRRGLTWCKGKTKPDNGSKISWSDFIEYMQSRPLDRSH